MPKYSNKREEILWKLKKIHEKDEENQLQTSINEEHQSFYQLLKLIPDELFEQIAAGDKNLVGKQGEISNEATKTSFVNWGQTVKVDVSGIYYPTTAVKAQSGEQVAKLQEYVKAKIAEGKRVRGAGIKHSWGRIFCDQDQYLVSLYPYQVSVGHSGDVEKYAKKMDKLEDDLAQKNIEHLCSIRHVRQLPIDAEHPRVRHLIKIGAGVSNEQLRIWCIRNNYQYKSNVIMVEVNLVGGLGTCSHGAGIGTQTLCDYIYEIQFIDHQGNLQTISKDKHPQLIKSAASSMGLLGIIVYVTMEMETLQIVQFVPRHTYKDLVVPWPKNYSHVQERKDRKEYQEWLHKQKPLQTDLDWYENMKKFKSAIHQTYCEWFYFPVEGETVYQNNWQTFKQKTKENVELIAKEEKGVFHEVYPSWCSKYMSKLSLWLGNALINKQRTQFLGRFIMKSPFVFFPKQNNFLNYPDAVHFQRGIQNMKVRDFEVEINIPVINDNGVDAPDYDLIQKIWWAALEYVEPKKKEINIALEMRIFKGSNATLAPEFGYAYVCSIEILRSLAIGQAQKEQWQLNVINIFNIWKALKDSSGNKVIIRPHWGKEWDFYPEIKAHVLQDTGLQNQFKQFYDDYEKIAKLGNFNREANLDSFSNQLYRELLSNAINSTETKKP